MTDRITPPPTDAGVVGELRHDTQVGDRSLTQWPTRGGRALAVAAVGSARRIGAHGTLAATLAIGIAAVVLLSFLASRIYDGVAERDGIAGLDVPVLHAAMTFRSPASDGLAATVASVFGPVGMPIIAVLALGVLALRRRSWTPVILVAAAGVGSLLMTIAGKDIIGRHRPLLSDAIPPYEYSPSFPSGHTLNATVILGVVAYLLILRRRTRASRVTIGAGAAVVAIVVGLTRILLGAHWFTDVLAGWLLGAAWLAFIVTAHRLYLTTRKQQPAPAC